MTMGHPPQDTAPTAAAQEALTESTYEASAPSIENAAEALVEAAAAAAGTPAESLADVKRQRDEFYDLLLRKSAEFDNYRKRVERERRELAELAAADLIKELLPLLDDLERALKAETGEAGAEVYRRGVEIIHKQMLDALARRGVTTIDPLGADFDPHWHEAVLREASPGHRDGEVLEVFSRGYRLGDRLLRPAMVRVASA